LAIRSLEVVRHYEVDEPVVMDRVRLAHALDNLGVQRGEAMPDGGRLWLHGGPGCSFTISCRVH
jgi:hypothetical protein